MPLVSPCVLHISGLRTPRVTRLMKIPDNEIEYFFTEHMPAGSECINKDMDETEDLWSRKKWEGGDSDTRSYILKKHPNINICTVGGSA